MRQPNILFLLVDQLASQVLTTYGGQYIDTPHIDRLAKEGVTFDNMISTCPVCTPYRSMLLTGRHPQTTGHVVNFVETRYDELGWGDIFTHAGYDTGYIGKWHLDRGSFPHINGADFVPEGRARLGFEYWRGYNFHMDYFNGTVNGDSWDNVNWKGYETEGLQEYVLEYLDKERVGEKPFCLMMSPHQPHPTNIGDFAPRKYYDRLPKNITFPPNYDGKELEYDKKSFRDYLAMILAVDDMVGDVIKELETRNLLDSTLIVFTTDHGTSMGAHGTPFWQKKLPWEEDVKVPLIMRLPGVFKGDTRIETLTAPVDLLPSICSICNIPIPRTVEGYDLSGAWLGDGESEVQEAVLMMNFCNEHDYLVDGDEWRGVRTLRHTYVKFYEGHELLFDNIADPQQQCNLVENPRLIHIKEQLNSQLFDLMSKRGDKLQLATFYIPWFDEKRRVRANAYGDLDHPENLPDFSLLG